MRCCDLTDADGLTVQELAIARRVLDRMADGVTKIQRCPQARLGFVLGHNLRLDGAAPRDDGRQDRRLLFEKATIGEKLKNKQVKLLLFSVEVAWTLKRLLELPLKNSKT